MILKRCSKCGAEKPLELFAPRKDRPDGRQYHCRECQNAKARTEEGRAIKKRYDLKHGNEIKSSWRDRNPKKRYAHEQVAYALRIGKIIKQVCEICGSEKSVAHHDDYDKPLEVRWLCQGHHKQWHSEHGEALNAR